MMDFLKKIKDKVEEFSPKNYSLILALPIMLLICGFLIWNFYLYTFGLQEDQILKAKFISTGLLFSIITFFVHTILNATYLISKKIFVVIFNYLPKKWWRGIFSFFERIINFLHLKFTFYIILFFIWFLIFIYFLFPILPATIGGGQPNSISLIATDSDMSLLNSLNINLAEGAKFQTENLCVLQQDEINIYIIRSDRVLMINNSTFKGMASLPGIKSVNEQDCIVIARSFSLQGLFFEIQLMKVQLRNFWHAITSQPFERLYIGTIQK